jgi:glycosyltransferase involved in cell wall biosynthesis
VTNNRSATRKRILVLTSTFPRWSGDREPPFVFELSKRLQEQFHVIVLAPHAPGAKRAEEIDGIEVRRFRYFIPRWQTLAYEGGILANLKKNKLNFLLVPFFILAELVSLVRLLHLTKVDVIHAHWLFPQGLIALTAKMLSPSKPAILCTSHGGDLYGLAGPLFTRIKQQVIRRVDKFTVVSYAMRDYASTSAGRQDIEVIPMGVDLAQRFTPSPNERRSSNELLFAGRLVEKKGVEYIIMAMPEILKRYPQTKLLIAGDGPERARLQRLSIDIGVESRVQFLGAVANTALQKLYRRAAIFVAPSVIARGGDQEGLGLVFVEALGCECPIVASDLPAIRDVVIDGVTGLICKQKDSADLAKKVQCLLDDPDAGANLGRAGRRHVEDRFDWQIISRRYKGLINGLT